MNDSNTLEELCLEIKYDLEEHWDLTIENLNSLNDYIDENKEKKQFVFHANKKLKNDFEDTTLIIYFDLNDKSTLNSLDIIESYKNNFLKGISECILEDIDKISAEERNERKIFVYYLTNDYGKMLNLRNLYDHRSSMDITNWNNELINLLNERLTINKINYKKMSKNIKLLFKSFTYLKSRHESKIKIESRVRRTTTTPLENAMGEVYTASLFDLAELFVKNGNDLFKDNLRLRVNHKSTDVDKGIVRTLKESPQEFWYLNNGITLLVDQNHIDFKHSNEISFILNDSKLNDQYQMSVINGAQTLNAAADFFYDLRLKSTQNNNDKRKKAQDQLIEQINKAKEKAFVILRVIQINTSSININDGKLDWINKIAIALNSQKPIKKEDIVSTAYFTKAINKIYDANQSDEYVFKIVRRGEKFSLQSRRYLIKELAKILVTYIEKKPNKARGSIEGNIQTSRSNDSESYSFNSGAFLNQEILIDDSITFERRVEKYKSDTFDFVYKPVNFLMVLNEKIEQLKPTVVKLLENKSNFGNFEISNKNDQVKLVDYAKGALSYGKYHLILCIFERELTKDINFSDLYESKFNLNLEELKEIEFPDEDALESLSPDLKEKIENEYYEILNNLGRKMNALYSWDKDASFAEEKITNKYLINAVLVFIKVWEKNKLSLANSNDFKIELSTEVYKNIIKEFINDFKFDL